MNNPSIPIKLAVARVIARRIVDNPGKFAGDLYNDARCFLAYPSKTYWEKPDNVIRWEDDAHFWLPIKRQMPEILAKLAEIDGH